MATISPPRVNPALLAALDSPEQIAREQRDADIRSKRLAVATRMAAKITARDLNTRFGFSR